MTPTHHLPRRRDVARLVAASPLALLASRAWADIFDYPTPPLFQSTGPVALRPISPRVALFGLAQVQLLDGPFLDAQRWNIGYMKRLDTDRLLHMFRLNAGLASTATPLGGWEAPDCELRGHFAGHYMSGCALAFAATGDEDMRARGTRMVTGLAECQRRLGQGGYVSAFPETFFDRLAAGQQVWAPFYTWHKIMAGLCDMYRLAGSDQALTVLIGMATWTDRWTAARDEPAMQKLLETEFGGMNDILYRLAEVTGDPHWIAVGDRFTKKRVFEPLANRKDMLRGLHMNTHVPQVIGASTRFSLTGDRRYQHVADFFWETVTQARTYATGGSSNNEHWLTEPGLLGTEAAQGDHHQECCCSYNMMKLGTQRYLEDPQVALIDYHERNLLNHRLGMIQPETGLTGYFLSLSPGAWKTHGTDDTSFWCCNGTALEDFSKLASMIYAHDADGLYVNLFIPSTLDWKDRGIRLRQETRFPDEPRTRLTVMAAAQPFTMRLRIPGWTSEHAQVRVNGLPVDASVAPGSYLLLHSAWRAGDVIEIDMPMPVRQERYADQPSRFALLVGPVVLAQQLPAGDMAPELLTAQGPNLAKAPPPVRPAALPVDSVARLKPAGTAPLHFAVELGDRTVLFKPIRESWERFSVYNETG